MILDCWLANTQMIQLGIIRWKSADQVGTLVPLFEKIMKETSIGSVSPIFKTDYGWHFLEVLNKKLQIYQKRK